MDSADLPSTGRYLPNANWASRAWAADEYVVRLNTHDQHRDSYHHESRVVGLLTVSDFPHGQHIAHGDSPDGPWYITERLASRTVNETEPSADPSTHRSIIESLGATLRAPGARPH